MKYSYTIFLSTLLGAGAFAANSKLNQYASISDCQSDSNIISHASPPEGSCHSIDSRTGALFLVTGGGADGAVYFGCSGTGCGQTIIEPMQEGACIALPSGVGSIFFGQVV
ncbi:hypothetical protein N431DRAFT_475935 [Stipitochalara longipes BDJ]|nr:hypothetical protein N431DRAFT_475935 [Stipitochalara longipes BDJ]